MKNVVKIGVPEEGNFTPSTATFIKISTTNKVGATKEAILLPLLSSARQNLDDGQGGTS